MFTSLTCFRAVSRICSASASRSAAGCVADGCTRTATGTPPQPEAGPGRRQHQDARHGRRRCPGEMPARHLNLFA